MVHMITNLKYFVVVFVMIVVSCATGCSPTSEKKILLDMVHHNPGEAETKSDYEKPFKLNDFGYGGKVFFLFDAAQFGITWEKYNPNIFPKGSTERNWVDRKQKEISSQYNTFLEKGLDVYCMMDMIVFPKKLVSIYKDEICSKDGKIDIHQPKTIELIEELIDLIIESYPQLSGLVVRTGETYLQDAPYYVGNNPISRKQESHILLINTLRKKICVEHGKKLIYRTWDFGHFHSTPGWYTSVVDNIEPHPNLFFSIKHTIVDFWRGTTNNFSSTFIDTTSNYWINEASKYGVVFNPTLGLGQHKQIVEVQCQREYEGKNAHPDYIAKGVIDGFPELANTTKYTCLRDFYNDKNFAGIWTWSRGGGWGGPYISNEFWTDANTFVLSHWLKNPAKSESDIFREFAIKKGFEGKDIESLHQICLLSADGVFHGQYSQYNYVDIDMSRDDYLGQSGPYKNTIGAILSKSDNPTKYLQEKAQAVQIWHQIDSLAQSLTTGNKPDLDFVKVSCKYGYYKYAIIEQQWNIYLLGMKGDRSGKYDMENLKSAFILYDEFWNKWKDLAKNPLCPSLYHEEFKYAGKTNESIEKYRRILK